MATHSSILAWKIPSIAEPCPWGHKQLDTTQQLNSSKGEYAVRMENLPFPQVPSDSTRSQFSVPGHPATHPQPRFPSDRPFLCQEPRKPHVGLPKDSAGTGSQAQTIRCPGLLPPLQVSPSRECLPREPQAGATATAFSLNTNYCPRKKGERERPLCPGTESSEGQ